jgi:membrane fusion protein, multidrug efflux system
MNSKVRRLAMAVASVGGLAAAGAFGAHYWTVGRFLQSTDDAYVKADFTTVAPKVPGYIAEVLVSDNEQVKAGQLLARIDDRDFRAALAQAQADVAAGEAAIGNIDARLALQQSVIGEAEAKINASAAAASFARQDDARYRDLMHTGYGTVQRAQQASASLRESAAELQRDRAALVAAEKQVGVLGTERAEAEAKLGHARAVARQAQLNLDDTRLTAPIDGSVGARSLRVGQYVQAGTPLMAVVPLRQVYVVANFKETQLTSMRGGEPVTLRVDSFPGVAVKGHVDSLAPASGLEFALLPPDNATGNFTKIVQRVPVKIDIAAGSPLLGRLRPGMSVVATVDTHAQPAAAPSLAAAR